MDFAERDECSSPDRRSFLQQAAGIAVGVRAPSVPSVEVQGVRDSLPTIALGRHKVTRLIVGGNPIYGHSHFNKLLSQHQTTWHTPKRVVELLKQCQQM